IQVLGIKIKKQRTSIKLKMPPNKRQPDFSKSRSLVVFLKRVIIYRLRCSFWLLPSAFSSIPRCRAKVAFSIYLTVETPRSV
ncbi:MAG: hypothetical protein LIR22_10370, partial [Bacillota bacterium]|nr:hypothetical protein [Bacillota bacterium]